MSKRIVICADGTWSRPEEDVTSDTPTNVLRLARAINVRSPIPDSSWRFIVPSASAGAQIRTTDGHASSSTSTSTVGRKRWPDLAVPQPLPSRPGNCFSDATMKSATTRMRAVSRKSGWSRIQRSAASSGIGSLMRSSSPSGSPDVARQHGTADSVPCGGPHAEYRVHPEVAVRIMALHQHPLLQQAIAHAWIRPDPFVTPLVCTVALIDRLRDRANPPPDQVLGRLRFWAYGNVGFAAGKVRDTTGGHDFEFDVRIGHPEICEDG